MEADMQEIDVAKRWNENADQWARDARAGFNVYRDKFTFPALLDALPAIKGLDVVDFECGEWTNTRVFARMEHALLVSTFQSAIQHGKRTEEADQLGI